MPFWKRKKTGNSLADLPPWDNTVSKQRQWEEQQTLARLYHIEPALKNLKVDGYHYKQQALSIASQLPEQGRTKKELLAVAYRQIRDQTNTTTLDFARLFYSARSVEVVHPHITEADRQTYVNHHRDFLTGIIQRLETEAAQERQALAEKQTLYDTVSQRVGQIQDAQVTREAELDQQLAEVRKRTQALQAQIAQRRQRSPTLPDPDLDRLETMLEELRRLKQ